AARFVRFERFVRSEIGTRIEQIRGRLAGLIGRAKGVRLPTQADLETTLDELQDRNPRETEAIAQSIAATRNRLASLVQAAEEERVLPIPPCVTGPGETLSRLVLSLDAQLTELQRAANSDELARLRKQYDDLAGRKWLFENKDQIR